MSFWRYKLLEMVVALATAPLMILVTMAWAWLWSGVVDFEQPGLTFLAFAIPLLAAWIALNAWATKRAERWWISRRNNAVGSAER